MLLILLLVGTGCCQTTLAPKEETKTVSSSQATQTAAFILSTRHTAKPLETTVAPTTSTTKESSKTTKAYVGTESPTTARHSTVKVHTSTKGVVKSARRQKLNSSGSSAEQRVAGAAVDCELPLLPNESRLWRGNETHELNLPVTECGAGVAGGTTPGDDECPPVIVSWEGLADIQSGDILIVRIADSLLLDVLAQQNSTAPLDVNSTHVDGDRVHRAPLQPAVYQVTRQGHEHCDVTDGMLLDITPLDEGGAKLFTLYDKDLSEGVNLFIVVSKNWGSQCVRLKVTVKSDNCGESQECAGKGVCYTNISMEGYECQCCPGFAGPHCEDRDVCNPSPCLNNGICVEITAPYSPTGEIDVPNFHCLCPYGFTGRKCEKDPCSSAPCLNGGSCMSMAMNGTTTFHCACADGWTGARCELSAAGGACASNPCANGICIEQTDNDIPDEKFRCFCQPGYTGDLCQIEYNECESSPCANGGTCTDRVGGFTCACGRGYTGNTCQLKVDLCSPNPCPERRFCVDHGNSYACECPRGYVGDECHIPTRSPCDTNPCAHGGTCWSDIDSFYCSCRPGYTGKICEEDFILESVVGSENNLNPEPRGGSVREVHLPLGLYHDRLHNVYIAAGTLGAAIAIVGVVVHLPLGLYHDRLHNVYIAAGTLGAAIAIVGVVVTACHCRVNKTYSRILSRISRVTEAGPPHHWLQDKRAAPLNPHFQPRTYNPTGPPPPAALDTTDMYYTLDFSDSQSSPLIQ
ncbi:EGF-like domain-containing protein [Phthorimaea operculella]|nr:EGF-like domain-containing protein [Phthorimaea operculella]